VHISRIISFGMVVCTLIPYHIVLQEHLVLQYITSSGGASALIASKLETIAAQYH
jgi:hypothetical protein